MSRAFSKILILVIFIVLAGGGFFAWWHFGTPKEAEVPEKMFENETANWKTYRNEDIGFEVKYPQNWFVREDTFAKEIYFGEKGEVIGAEGKKIPLEKIGFSIGFYINASKLWGNEDSLLLKDWISKTFLPLQEGEIRETITLGANNYNGILLKKYKGVGAIRLITTVYAERNGSIYELKGEVPTTATVDFPSGYNYSKVFNQMLSTFKFLEIEDVKKKDETADWRTYKNEEYGFEIKYPENWRTVEFSEKDFMGFRPIEPKPGSEGYCYICIGVKKNPQKLALQEYYNQERKKWDGDYRYSYFFFYELTPASTTVGEKQAFKFENAPGVVPITFIVVSYDDLIFEIGKTEDLSYTEVYSSQELKNIFNQMLSTFRFLE